MISIFLLFCLFSACSRPQVGYELNRLETLTETQPKEAYRQLSEFKENTSRLSLSDRVRKNLLTVRAKNKAFIPLEGKDTLMLLAAIEYYRDQANPLMECYYLMGSIYRDLGDAPASLDAFQKAIGYADTTASDCNYRLLSRIYAQKSDLERMQKLRDVARCSAERAAHYALCARDSLFHLECRAALISLACADGDYSLLLNEAFPTIRAGFQLKDSVRAVRQAPSFAWHFLQLGKQAEANEMIQLYESFSKQVDASTRECSFPLYYSIKGRLMLMQHQSDSAEFFFRKALRASDWNNRQAACRGMKELYQEKEIIDSAFKYSCLQCEAVDSDYQEKISESILQMERLYRYSHIQEERGKTAIALERQKRTSIYLGAAIILVIAAGSGGLWLLRVRQRHLLLLAEGEKAQAENTLMRYRLDLTELQQKLQQQSKMHQTDQALIESARRMMQELEENIARAQADVAEKEAEVIRLKRDKSLMRKEVKMEEERNEAQLLRYLNRNKMIAELKHKAAQKKEASSADIYHVKAFMLNNHPLTVENLRKEIPKIRETEVSFVYLYRLGFSTREIATLLNLAYSTISNYPSRLFQKAQKRKPECAEEAEEWLKEL